MPQDTHESFGGRGHGVSVVVDDDTARGAVSAIVRAGSPAFRQAQRLNRAGGMAAGRPIGSALWLGVMLRGELRGPLVGTIGLPFKSNETGEQPMVRLHVLTIGLVVALALSGMQGAMAQEYSDAKLQSFASAVLAVNALVEEWRPQIQAATTEADRQKLAEQANQEMRAAVEGTEGMSVDEYQAIAQAAQGDTALMARIDQVFKEMAPAAE